MVGNVSGRVVEGLGFLDSGLVERSPFLGVHLERVGLERDGISLSSDWLAHLLQAQLRETPVDAPFAAVLFSEESVLDIEESGHSVVDTSSGNDGSD